MELLEQIRGFWDDDAAFSCRVASHAPRTVLERAVWSAALRLLLPLAPADVLDVGAGTGFLSLRAARLGHRVTMLDLSARMVQRLREKAAPEGVSVHTAQSPADAPTTGRFDTVMGRHVAWTLPDPGAAWDFWRAVAARGRLLLFASAWAARPIDTKCCGQACSGRCARSTVTHPPTTPITHPGWSMHCPTGRG